MVKRQKEKQYQSAREYRTNSKIRSGNTSSTNTSNTTRRLPFKCCALSLLPFKDPVCTKKGIIFENSIILPHILKYNTDPINGDAISTSQLIKLNMTKSKIDDNNDDDDDDDEAVIWECPILNKVFNDYSKIVAIKISKNEANVYSYEAVQELNIKLKNYEDLITGKRFNIKKDMIILQDPQNEEHEQLRDICNFHHMKTSRDDNKDNNNSNTSNNIRGNTSITRIMDKLADNQNKKRKLQVEEEKQKKLSLLEDKNKSSKHKKIYACDITGVNETIGKCSGSFTSTSLNISSTNNLFREATTNEILDGQLKTLSKLKKKGYVRMHTSLGILDIELHCDYAPRTTYNFLGLCKDGKYNKSLFHRNIPGFMIQTGKPPVSSDSTNNDESCSIWKKPFKDEFHTKLSHGEKGILSMANSGPNTNRSQFFITYKNCTYLDNKHSVFGNVIEGKDVLSAMEQIPTYDHGKKKDRPREDICITKVDILVNPVDEAITLEESRVLQNYEKRMKESNMSHDDSLKNNTKTNSNGKPSSSSSGSNIGKYLPKRVNNSVNKKK